IDPDLQRMRGAVPVWAEAEDRVHRSDASTSDDVQVRTIPGQARRPRDLEEQIQRPVENSEASSTDFDIAENVARAGVVRVIPRGLTARLNIPIDYKVSGAKPGLPAIEIAISIKCDPRSVSAPPPDCELRVNQVLSPGMPLRRSQPQRI